MYGTPVYTRDTLKEKYKNVRQQVVNNHMESKETTSNQINQQIQKRNHFSDYIFYTTTSLAIYTSIKPSHYSYKKLNNVGNFNLKTHNYYHPKYGW